MSHNTRMKRSLHYLHRTNAVMCLWLVLTKTLGLRGQPEALRFQFNKITKILVLARSPRHLIEL